MGELVLITPTWPAPAPIVAYTTTRQGGVSVGAFASFNLGAHVGDNPEHVHHNRQLLQQKLLLPTSPLWLNQVHGTTVVTHPESFLDKPQQPASAPTADGSYTRQVQHICAVLTADCLPVLLCNRAGTEVAAVHVGWRGCLAGILSHAIAEFQSPPAELLAWLGPAIGPEAFEVGPEVFAAFVAAEAANAGAFEPPQHGSNKYHANLYQLARLSLAKAGVNAVYGGDYCTVSDPKRFFSYRQASGMTGRMASLIFIATT